MNNKEQIEENIQTLLFNLAQITFSAVIGTFTAAGFLLYFSGSAESIFELAFISVFIGSGVSSILTLEGAENYIRGRILEDYEVELTDGR